ncbi:MAG TPA: OmpA family protein [Polyangiaceae bacterium]
MATRIVAHFTQRGSWIRAALTAAALVTTPKSAAAQAAIVSGTRIPENTTVNNAGMDTHLFRPALDSKGFFSVNGSEVLASRAISFGLVLDYGRNLMRTSFSDPPLNYPAPPGAPTPNVPCTDENCTPRDPAGNVLPTGQGFPTTGSGTNALAKNSFQGTFGFNYGLFGRAVVGITMPVILMSGERAYQIGQDGSLYNAKQLDAQEISTIALHGKLRLLRVDRGLGLGVSAQVGFPVSSAPRDLGADPGLWFWPQAILEKRFGFTQRFKIGLNLGYRGHTGSNPKFEHNGTETQLAEGVFEASNLVTYGLGLSFRATDMLDLVGESYGSFQAGGGSDAKQKFSNEFVGGFKIFVEKNSFLMVGGGSRAFSTGFEAADLRLILGFVFEPAIGDRDGDGYRDDEDACPDQPEDFDGFEDSDGCPDPDNDKDGILDVDDRCPNVPEDKDGDQDEDGCPESRLEGDRDGDGIVDSADKCPDQPEDIDRFQDTDGCPDPDNDKDGILDKDDRCPNDPEDFDGFEDKDGCPEPDNDHDQILDKVDKCPNEPETYNGFQDEDGCPDKGKGIVIVEGNEIQILQKVQFETNSARILPESNPILDAVASVMKGHPEFQVVEVGGHADERASDQHNLQLTKARAASVVVALKQRGVAGDRLVSQGYGEYCPLDKGSNPAAWEKNRRVEFKVVKTKEGVTNVERGCPQAVEKGVFPPPVH